MDNKKIVFSSPQGKGTSARSKKCDERWNRVKADVHRYFIDENKTLEDTMALLKDDSPGLAKAKRTWQGKVGEWGYTKYKKRKPEGERVISNQKIASSKRRKVEDISLGVGTPPDIRYNTPDPGDHEEDVAEENGHQLVAGHRPYSQPSNFVVVQARSVGSVDSALDDVSISKTYLPDTQPVRLEPLLDPTTTLAQYQSAHDVIPPEGLKKQFQLAQVADQSGCYKEAEYHYRQILQRDPHVDVQIRLGMLLANDTRLDESVVLLFSALAGYIVQFTSSPMEENERTFAQLTSLFNKLIADDWLALRARLGDMMDTIQDSISKQSIADISPQLLIHGFSLAHECLVLDLTNAAEHMYQQLLEHANFHLNGSNHRISKAIAYREYGTILSMKRLWKSSARQLLLACESASPLRLQDSQLSADLNSDFGLLFPHCDFECDEECSIIAQIGRYLSSESYKPLHQEEQNATSNSNGSVSIESCKYGVTYSVSEVTGISDSWLMGP